MRAARLVPVLVLLACSAIAAATMQDGLDYFGDGSAAVDALARLDLPAFFASQPLMGPLSVVLRAPVAALVFHQSLTVVYFAGVVPCLALFAAFAVWLRRVARRRGASDEQLLAAALLTLGSPLVLRAILLGHPEDLLATAFAVAAVLLAARERPLAAGVALGLAFAGEQWALIAVVPALLVSREGRLTLAVGACGLGAASTLPLLLGNPDRFFAVLRAAGSVDPQAALDGVRPAAAGAHVTPLDAWWPFGHDALDDGVANRFVGAAAARFAHPVILLAGVPLGWALLRRRGGRAIGVLDALRLLALLSLLRCVLDPMSLDYYHLPLLVSLGALAGLGSARDARLALVAGAALCAAMAGPAASQADIARGGDLRCAAYLLAVLAVAAWLSRDLFARPRPVAAADRAAPLVA